MKRPIVSSALALLTMGFVLTGCGPSLTLTQDALPDDVSAMPEKTTALKEAQLKTWPQMGMISDTVPGMSVKKTYDKIIKGKKGESVIVAILDSGVDIFHEDLDDVLWTNKDEVPNNGIDDDNNGYVDDIHGWNFLGDQVHANLEYTRFVKKLKPKYEDKSADEIAPENREEYKLYKRAKEKYDTELAQAETRMSRISAIKSNFESAVNAVKEEMGGLDFTRQELQTRTSDNQDFSKSKFMVLQMMKRAEVTKGKKLEKFLTQLEDAVEYFNNKLNYHLNIEFTGRTKVGDDPNDLSDTDYGDNRVAGPTEDKEDVTHGTHVAGIVAAERNNGIGMNGVANNVKIMALRAVPDGDEFDKDIALGIRYAVDNGADIINMSFGKGFSAHPEWVIEAIKYAAKHDVLIVKAAGNDSKDLDENRTYPNDQWPGHESEISDNVIMVGALNFAYGQDLVAAFSNYGTTNVDVFAPGVQIWSTVPNNEYKFLQGTSMASPEVAGVAAMIRSYFPELTAPQVKNIIMESAITTDIVVNVPHDRSELGATSPQKTFDQLSISGGMVNLYNALIMASKVAQEQ